MPFPLKDFALMRQLTPPGSHLSGLQRIKSWCAPISQKLGLGMGSVRHSSQYDFSWIHCHGNGRRALPPLPRATDGLASAEYARQAEQTRRLPRRRYLSSQFSKLIHDRCGPEDRYVQPGADLSYMLLDLGRKTWFRSTRTRICLETPFSASNG